MDYTDIDDFSGVNTYQYDPRAKRKPFSELAAAANAKLGAKPVAPAPVATPAATPAAAPAAPAASTADQDGMMGYGKILQALNSPEAWEAGMEAGMARGDASALKMMQMSEPRRMAYGGRMSWAEALNNGIKQGIGMYDYMQSQRAKSEALRKYKDIFGKLEAEKKERELFNPGRGSGQHSVQGNSDYEFDL